MRKQYVQKRYRKKRYAPYKVYGAISIVAIVMVTGYLMMRDIAWWIAYLLAINSTTLLLFGFDKVIAGTDGVRVPERILYVLALCGASPALLTGQRLFRHKTVKTSFQFTFWAIVIAQVVAIIFMFHRAVSTAG